MKNFFTFGIVLATSFLCEAQNIVSQPTQIAIPSPTPYAITVQDANSRVWQRMDYAMSPSGGVITNTHGYTEICSGLNHWAGKWVESSEQIDILPNGTAVATNGQHQAYFPGDIYQGQIELVTPDGQHLKSRPMGLSYFDGTKSVLIAELTNSIGVVVGNNQVIYPNAFTDFKADLRYTYTKAGFEQDIILRQQPPTPESMGLNPDTARLQILTEFFSPPQPTIQTDELPSQAGVSLSDESLDFGTMQVIRGRAFLLGQNAQDAGAMVDKQWLLLDGRQFLVEEVPVDAILEGLAALPLTAMNSGSGKNSHTASKHLKLPPQRLVKNTSKTMMLAKADVPTQGFVLDYQTVGSRTTNYIFRGDSTYYISGNDVLTGTNIIEGGAVIKFGNGGLNLNLTAPAVLLTQTAPYRMAILTSTNDNSVGETISGSSGNPTVGAGTYLQYNMNAAATASTWSNLRFAYAGQAIAQISGGASYTSLHTIQDCQFVNCATAIFDSTYQNLNTLNQQLYNVLFSHCGTAVINGNAVYYHGDMIITGQNVTADQVTNLLSVWSGDTIAMANSRLVNCVLTGVPHQIFFGDTSGSTTMVTNNCYVASSGSGVYQAAGAGNYYLATNSLRNIGTTNIDSTVLADLRTKTTYPPILYSNVTVSINTTLNPQAQRDTDTPDLGYHYDPIDYLVDQFGITNALLTLTNGVAIAGYNDSVGIGIEDGSSIVSFGSALYPNWLVRYSSVQEQPVSLGPLSPSSAVTVNPYHVTPLQPTGLYRFTKFACLAGGGNHFYNYQASWSFTNLLVQDCEFWSGTDMCGGYSNTVAVFRNNLFWRSVFQCSGSPINSLSVSNNLFFGISTAIKIGQPSGGVWYAFNNVFDTCLISAQVGMVTCTNGYNAYINSTNRLIPNSPFDIVTNTVVYQTGPLGTFYQPTTSPLIDKGSTNANLVGLYHYTVITNLVSGLEIKETNSIVDIGYHYVATDANGIPIDTDGDGIADYLEDANGNGLVDNGETSWTNYNSLNGLISPGGLVVFTPLK
jgi:hypothetical protein